MLCWTKIPDFLSMFPDGKVIHVIRDTRDVLSSFKRVTYEPGLKYLDAVFCYGHNVMIRMKPVLEVGGFSEGYTSEDFATAVRIAEKGYKSRFVPLHTYEAMPENIRGFIKRQHKWTRGSMEFLSFIKNNSISLKQKALLFSIPLGHFSYIGILTAMFLTVFGFT